MYNSSLILGVQCYFQSVIFAALTRTPYWWHEASSHILAKRCHFWGWHSHKLQNYHLPPTNSAHYLNSYRAHSWSLLFPGWEDYSWVIQEIVDESKKCWEQRKKERKAFSKKHHGWRTVSEWEFLKLSQKVWYIRNPFHTSWIPEDEGLVHSTNIDF